MKREKRMRRKENKERERNKKEKGFEEKIELTRRRVRREGKKKEGKGEIKRKMEKGGGGKGNGHFIPPLHTESWKRRQQYPTDWALGSLVKFFTVVAFSLYIQYMYMELPALRPPTFCDTSLA
jgi:hypothetical protein